ncbi:MAG: hypothetical protein FWE03_06550 [Firmicutes bacterium]|nr:hypothetical protein [Bacillota bacterium]
MIRKRISNIIIFSILAAVLIIAVAWLFSWIGGIRREFRQIYYGGRTSVYFSIEEGFGGQGGLERWRFKFELDGQWFTGVTTGIYTSTDIQGQQIRFSTDDIGHPITYPIGGEALEWDCDISGRTYFIVAMSREDGYFEFFEPPHFGAPLVVLGLLCLALFGIIFNLVFFLKDKNVVKNGVFAYALIEETFWSKWGSRRWIAIRFRYQDEQEQWKEGVSHYTFRPAQIAYLKNLEAIGIKYLNDRAVVVERLTNAGPIDPPF